MSTALVPLFQSLQEYKRDLRLYDAHTLVDVGRCVRTLMRWIEALPSLRYYGESPCWRADCPMCGAALDLWIAVVVIDDAVHDEGWKCHVCHSAGTTPASLAEWVATVQAPSSEGGAP